MTTPHAHVYANLFVNDDGWWLTATSEFLLDRFNRCFKYIDWDFARGAGR